VSQSLVDRARHQLSSRQFGGFGSGRTGPCMTNLFGGLVRCGVCGGSMYLCHHGSIGGRGQPRRTHPGYLRCSRNKRNMACSNDGTIPYDPFERLVVGLIGGFSVPEGEAAGGAHSMDHAADTLIERLAKAKAVATRTYDRFKTLTDSFADALADATPTPLMTRRIAELEAQHATQEAEIKDLETQIEAERRNPNPSDEIEAVQRILNDVWACDFDTRLLVRTRVAAGMKRFITHFCASPIAA
jgi:hypothetical protein